jgi:prepilin signal peptidase PulO-like enzyme (type II secretory pathway)
MIQRIQTIFLILLIVIGYVNLWQDPVYAWFTANDHSNSNVLMFWHSYSGVVTDANTMYTPDLLTAFFTVVMMISGLATVFLFRNRRLQLKAAWFTLGFSILLVGVLYLRFFLMSWAHENYTGQFGIHLVWPHFFIFFAALSVYNIRKDERLVRSMDRIR